MRYDPYNDEQQQSFNFPVRRPAPATEEAKASIEEVFADESEPQWMTDRRQAEQEAADQGLTISVKKAWERAAAISRQRIADQHPSRKRVQAFDGSPRST